VPTEVPAPVTVEGERLRAETPGAVTVRTAVVETPLLAAVIVVVEFVVPVPAVTVKVAVEEPAATVTEAGTVATAVALEVSATTTPEPPALPVRVTVPVEVEPYAIDVGLRVTELTAEPVKASVPVAVVEPVVPVTVTLVLAPTVEVVAVNVAVVAPAATVTLAGTVTEAAPDERATGRPPVGAAPLMVTVPVELAPPATVAGLKLSAEITGELTVSTAVPEVPLNVPVIVEVPLRGNVVTVKVALVAPDATVTDAGTVAREVLDEVRATTAPPVPAALEIVTVPVDGVTPATVVGLSETVVTVGARTVSVFETVVVPVVAETETGVVRLTAWLVAVNVAVVAPPPTVTDPGTVTAALPEASVTVRPPAGAAPARVTVPVDDVPPTTDDGEKAIVLTTAGMTGRATRSVIPHALAVKLAVTLLATT